MQVGSNLRTNANNQHIVGSNNTIRGHNNKITGSNNKVFGNDNVGTGSNNTITGNNNHWTGSNNKMAGENNSANGSNNRINGESVADFTGQGSGGVIIDGVTIGDVGDGEVVIRGRNHGIAKMITSGGATFTFGGGGMHMDNSKRKAVKRERSPSPSFIEVPFETDKDEEAPEDVTACVICITSLPLCAAIPCGHKCLCCKCARELGKDGTAEKGSVQCPVCREKIDAIRRIY